MRAQTSAHGTGIRIPAARFQAFINQPFVLFGQFQHLGRVGNAVPNIFDQLQPHRHRPRQGIGGGELAYAGYIRLPAPPGQVWFRTVA
jgi:hypothetical protein